MHRNAKPSQSKQSEATQSQATHCNSQSRVTQWKIDHATQSNTTQSKASGPCNATQRNAMQRNAKLCNAGLCQIPHRKGKRTDTRPSIAKQRKVMQNGAMQSNRSKATQHKMQITASSCKALQSNCEARNYPRTQENPSGCITSRTTQCSKQGNAKQRNAKPCIT